MPGYISDEEEQPRIEMFDHLFGNFETEDIGLAIAATVDRPFR